MSCPRGRHLVRFGGHGLAEEGPSWGHYMDGFPYLNLDSDVKDTMNELFLLGGQRLQLQ